MKKIISFVAVACSLSIVQGSILFDMGANAADGWTQVNNNLGTYSGANGVNMVLSGSGNLFAQTQTNTVQWQEGSFHGFSGTVLQEMSYRLGLGSPVGQSVWGDGLKNGGYTNNSMKITGLTAGERYCFYVILGTNNTNANNSGVQLGSAFADDKSSLSFYEATTSGAAVGTEVGYASMNVSDNYSGAINKVSVLKYENILADNDGSVTFTLTGSRSGVSALALSRMADLVPEPSTAMLGLVGMGLFVFRRRK